ncbi:protein TALPID3-like isoform X2 [Cyprinus carpio]|uniref:Protein TALPID3-like isoform X2 n=1 Tax=Cyprinus carpio TaxID=7962 RepID=A0A9Q9Z032_CYPCA|nr:protein TALPID3-like isoform X2 [Cyprinus carpio]
MAAVRVLTEEGVLLPNLMTSLNSSLHGVQDMDYDPPSEGQVIGAPRLPAHHDPVLSLLARMEHGLVNQLKAARGGARGCLKKGHMITGSEAASDERSGDCADRTLTHGSAEIHTAQDHRDLTTHHTLVTWTSAR